LPGRIYVALPNFHVLVEPGQLRILGGPRINRHRPAIDALFRSAAAAYGDRVVGVVLTGALDDGAAGLAAIKAAGGIAIVQDPNDAFVGEMPRRALEAVTPHHCVPLDAIPRTHR
jgi:two-component system, chemotaxis family, protein-glutamate methylesterase/glutaminase